MKTDITTFEELEAEYDRERALINELYKTESQRAEHIKELNVWYKVQEKSIVCRVNRIGREPN